MQLVTDFQKGQDRGKVGVYVSYRPKMLPLDYTGISILYLPQA